MTKSDFQSSQEMEQKDLRHSNWRSEPSKTSCRSSGETSKRIERPLPGGTKCAGEAEHNSWQPSSAISPPLYWYREHPRVKKNLQLHCSGENTWLDQPWCVVGSFPREDVDLLNPSFQNQKVQGWSRGRQVTAGQVQSQLTCATFSSGVHTQVESSQLPLSWFPLLQARGLLSPSQMLIWSATPLPAAGSLDFQYVFPGSLPNPWQPLICSLFL